MGKKNLHNPVQMYLHCSKYMYVFTHGTTQIYISILINRNVVQAKLLAS